MHGSAGRLRFLGLLFCMLASLVILHGIVPFVANVRSNETIFDNFSRDLLRYCKGARLFVYFSNSVTNALIKCQVLSFGMILLIHLLLKFPGDPGDPWTRCTCSEMINSRVLRNESNNMRSTCKSLLGT